ARRIGFVGAMDNIVTDRRGLRAVEHRPKRGHAAFLQRTVEHDTVPSVHGDEGGTSKIRGRTATHSGFAMADTAKPIVQPLARNYCSRASGVGWRIDDQFR